MCLEETDLQDCEQATLWRCGARRFRSDQTFQEFRAAEAPRGARVNDLLSFGGDDVASSVGSAGDSPVPAQRPADWNDRGVALETSAGVYTKVFRPLRPASRRTGQASGLCYPFPR